MQLNDSDTTHTDNDEGSSRRVFIPPRDSSGTLSAQDRDAAARLARDQVHNTYSTSPPNQLKPQPVPQPESPYQRTHGDALQYTDKTTAWKHYHNTWQQYYQEYYKRYYLHQLHEQKKELSAKEQAATKIDKPAPLSTEPDVISPDEATKKLHNEIVEKVKKQASNVRKSTHFMPLVSALVVGLLFLFVQYNRLFVAQVKAYVSPGSTSSQGIIIDPTASTKVGPEPRVIIPKINVDAPAVYGVETLDEGPIQNALREGVVHYPIPGANSNPGQAGNAVFLGHSSNDVFDNGKYKFVFLLLERMEKGDTFYIHYNGTRYTYSVTSKEVIDPTEVNKLVMNNSKPMATLVTCVPPGTALKRLVVVAEQISPDPTTVTAAPQQDASKNDPATIPDYTPSFLQRLLGH